MRFLHTADWHVGKTLRGRSRMDEFAAALEEVSQVAREAKVDAILLAGDVFDSPMPPPEAERLVYDFLARLLPERIACVMIAGNHDHPKKLAALARLLEGLRIFVRAEVRAPDRGGLVEVPSRDGASSAQVAVLPFVPERKMVEACQLLEPEHEWYAEYARRTEQILAHLAGAFRPDAVNLLLAHLLISGARVGTGERPLHLGEIYGVNAQQVPSGVQYVGLGHLHRPQEVLAPSRTFYAGSLIELDFGEKEQDKRVVVVEAQPGRPAEVESVPIRAGRRLRDVRGSLRDVLALAPEARGDFLRVTVEASTPMPGLAEQVREHLPNAVDVRLALRGLVEEAPTVLGSGARPPAEVFGEYYREKHGAAPAPELLALFHEVYGEAVEP
jgi:DNA repair protein SbcD/Mre11